MKTGDIVQSVWPVNVWSTGYDGAENQFEDRVVHVMNEKDLAIILYAEKIMVDGETGEHAYVLTSGVCGWILLSDRIVKGL